MNVNILNKETGNLCRATITKVRLQDFDKITDDRFDTFKWQEFRRDYTGIFKLMKDGIILGLMQFTYENVFVQIKELTKLELSVENRGANKKYDYIAGCLIAYACLKTVKSSKWDMGIYYSRKTKHIYINKYGMVPFDEYYVQSTRDNSLRLINKYLNIAY